MKSLANPFTLALVTGASSGIGSALCHLLAKQGIPLLITGRNASRLNDLGEKLKKNVPIVSLTADLANPEDRACLIQEIHKCKPDLVINNAGFGLYGEALSYATKEQMEILTLNAAVVLEITLESARTLMGAGKQGVILNVSSSADRLIFPSFAVYASSKAFVTNVSESLDYEMQPHGIRVLAACPGMVDTSFRTRASGSSDAQRSFLSMNADYAAQQIWRQIQNRQRVRIFDFKTWCGLFLARLIPKSWLARILSKTIKSFHPSRPIFTNSHHPKE